MSDFNRFVLGPATAYALAVQQGFEGTLDDWLNSLKGKDGKDGVDGKDGHTPAKGVDYFDGQDGKDGTNGKDGSDGADGETPYIGANGNWFIGETDTGVPATPAAFEVTDAATVGQTIQVAAVDANGKPTAWSPVDFPSGTKTPRLLHKIVFEEDEELGLKYYFFSQDSAGNPLNLEAVFVAMKSVNHSTASGAGEVRLYINVPEEDTAILHDYALTAGVSGLIGKRTDDGYACMGCMPKELNGWNTSIAAKAGYRTNLQRLVSFSNFSDWYPITTVILWEISNGFGKGSEIEIWGIDA